MGFTQKRQLPVFEERPYGGRLVLDATRTIMVIAPHMNTAAGISPAQLRNGLRGHEGEASERVTFLRFADSLPVEHTSPLVYRFEHNGEIKEESYRVGQSFYSVQMDGQIGFWHVLENNSDRPIMLLITLRRIKPKRATELIREERLR